MKWVVPLLSFVIVAASVRYIDLWSNMAKWLESSLGYSAKGAEQVRGSLFAAVSTYAVLVLTAIMMMVKTRIEIGATVDLSSLATSVLLRISERRRQQIEFRVKMETKSRWLYRFLAWLDDGWAVRISFPLDLLTVRQNSVGSIAYREEVVQKRLHIVVPILQDGFSPDRTKIVRVLVDKASTVGSDQIYLELWSSRPWATALPVMLLVRHAFNPLKVDVID